MRQLKAIGLIGLSCLAFAGFVKNDPILSDELLNENTTNVNEKQLMILRHKNAHKGEGMYFGARALTLMDYQISNKAGKFGWLMRFPGTTNQEGTTVSEAVIHSLQLGVVGHASKWFSLVGSLSFNPQQSFSHGEDITGLNRNQTQMRRAYVIIGNLAESPVFFTFGKFMSPFGLMDTVNPFTSSSLWHSFAGLAYGFKAEYYKNHWHLAAELAQGGDQFRAMQTKSNAPSKLDNLVFDAEYMGHFADAHFIAGASYLKGSNYCQGFPIFHFEPCAADTGNNPAVDYYMKIQWPRLLVKAEIARTLDVWPGLAGPPAGTTGALEPFPKATKVKAFEVGVKYKVPIKGKDFYFSGSFGRLITGPKDANWNAQGQTVFGISTKIFKNSKIFFEFVKVRGFVPLNAISGSFICSSDDEQTGVPDANGNCAQGSSVAYGSSPAIPDATTNAAVLGLEIDV